MPIPPFTLDNILPAFVGPDPGGPASLMSPHDTTVSEVVSRFGTTDHRRTILAGWIQYRQALRSIGITEGFQWLAGSFVENKPASEPPHDLDLVVMFQRPLTHQNLQAIQALAAANAGLFDRARVKQQWMLDTLLVDLSGTASALVAASAYYLQLFSHQRKTFLWKGILRVQQDDRADEAALLASLLAAGPSGGQP